MIYWKDVNQTHHDLAATVGDLRETSEGPAWQGPVVVGIIKFDAEAIIPVLETLDQTRNHIFSKLSCVEFT